jgi:hypothetical protein
MERQSSSEIKTPDVSFPTICTGSCDKDISFNISLNRFLAFAAVMAVTLDPPCNFKIVPKVTEKDNYLFTYSNRSRTLPCL